jgi:hypothetical protein
MKSVLLSLALSSLAYSATFNPNNHVLGTGNIINGQVVRSGTGMTSSNHLSSNDAETQLMNIGFPQQSYST